MIELVVSVSASGGIASLVRVARLWLSRDRRRSLKVTVQTAGTLTTYEVSGDDISVGALRDALNAAIRAQEAAGSGRDEGAHSHGVHKHGVRRLCMAYDIEAYSGKGTRRELAAQEQLAGLLDYAFTEAGLARGSVQVQEQGDGGLALLPTGGLPTGETGGLPAGEAPSLPDLDEPRMIVRLIRAVETGLAENNEALLPDRRMRLRLALHQGVVHRASHGYAGPAVTEVCRVRDSGAVRDALAGSAGYLVVAVADGLYRDVLADGPYGLPGSAFVRVMAESKMYSAPAWVYLPGDTEPGMLTHLRPTRPRPRGTMGRAT
jgi:hypothetical protein